MTLTLAACSAAPASEPAAEEPAETPAAETIDVLVPSGAPALGALGAFDQDNVNVEVVQGTDVLTAELAKPDSEYEIIIAPINVGVKIWSQKEVYQLNGVLTWGNLYIVADEAQAENGEIAAFGEGAVPGLVFASLMPELSSAAVYYPSVAEAQQALLGGQAQSALLAQPAAAAAIAKGKENGQTLSITADLQTLWQEQHATDEKGYPQAAVFVKAADADKAASVIQLIADFDEQADEAAITEKIESVGAETLGVPNAQIAVKTWPAQNIHYKKAAAAKADIEKFLQVFKIELPENIIQ